MKIVTCRFVAHVANRVVQTSSGTIVHLELGNVMRVQTVTYLSSSVAISRSPVPVAAYRDRDFLSFDYCNKRRHLLHECWTKLKHERRLLKLQSHMVRTSPTTGAGVLMAFVLMILFLYMLSARMLLASDHVGVSV